MPVPRPRTKPHYARFAEAISFLVKSPRTAEELREVMEIQNNYQTRKYIKALREEGLLYVGERRGCRRVAVYHWQPSPFHYSDVEANHVPAPRGSVQSAPAAQ